MSTDADVSLDGLLVHSGKDRRSILTIKSRRSKVKNELPPYLRVHHGPRPSATQRPPEPSSSEQFWLAYSAATGWRVDRPRPGKSVELMPAVEMDMMAGAEDDVAPAVSQAKARMLAECAAGLAQEIEELKSTIRRQEAELAARAAVIHSPETQLMLADQVETTLQQAIAGCEFDAAAIYLLDDDTQYLKTRAVVGLPADRLKLPPRPLRGSRADLESMVQGVVAIENNQQGIIDTWKCPEPCGAAICAALMKGDLPIGTLWLFSSKPTKLEEAESAIAQMAASQLTLQLSVAANQRDARARRIDVRHIRDIAHWQHSSLPSIDALAEQWRADGMIESPSNWAIGWHTWDVLPDGSLMFAIAEAEEKSAAGAMIAATARAALTAHCGYRHTPLQMMQRINDTLWQSNSAEQLVSMLYARLDPSSGEGEVVAAGKIHAMLAGRNGYRPLSIGHGYPLASGIDANACATTFHMTEGEILLAHGQGVMDDGVSQELLGNVLRESARQLTPQPLPAIRRAIADIPNMHERGLLSMTRLITP